MIEKIIASCKIQNDFQYFKNVIDPTFITWDDVYNYFLPRTIENVELFFDKKIAIPKQEFYQDRDFIVHSIAKSATFCISKFWNINYKTQILWDSIVDEHDGFGVDFHLYGGLTANAQSFPPHNDLATNYIIQLDGSCEWTIYNERASYEEARDYVVYPVHQLTVKTKQLLNPGDIIFIPPGVHHHCKPLGKRLSLSIPIL